MYDKCSKRYWSTIIVYKQKTAVQPIVIKSRIGQPDWLKVLVRRVQSAIDITTMMAECTCYFSNNQVIRPNNDHSQTLNVLAVLASQQVDSKQILLIKNY